MKHLIFIASLFISTAGCHDGQMNIRSSPSHPTPPAYPAFSWDTVPQFGFLSLKRTQHLTGDQARNLAQRFPILALCKHNPADPNTSTEQELIRTARKIKSVNPNIKLLYYWNTTLAQPGSLAYRSFASHPEWVLHNNAGQPLQVRQFALMDTSKKPMRQWWVEAAFRAIDNSALDGIFADAICKYGMGQLLSRYDLTADKKQALTVGLFDMLKATQEKIGSGKLMIYNGLRGDLKSWADGGAKYLDCTSGAMVEHFAGHSGRDKAGKLVKENLANDIELIGQATHRGKIVLVKGWPGQYSWLSEDFKTLTDADRRRISNEHLTFSLAAFLIAAEPYCYFGYTLGYLSGQGLFAEYDDLQRPLGPPLEKAKKIGWIYTREFKHASISLDIENEKAIIDWH